MQKRKSRPKDEALYVQPTPLYVGINGCCPRCGEGHLFASLLKPAGRCMNCQLDFSFINAGDGPTIFVIMIVGFIVTGLEMIVETGFSPPIWMHMILWIPLIIAFSILGLRILKGIMIALQYQTNAVEGVISNGD